MPALKKINLRAIVFSLSIVIYPHLAGVLLASDYSVVTDEEYEVYSSLFDAKTFQLWISNEVLGKKPGKFVIEEMTAHSQEMLDTSDVCGFFAKQAGFRISNSLCGDFKNKIHKVYRLENKFSVSGKNLNLISNEAKEKMFRAKEAGWDDFYKQYPTSSGMISFSRVGFNTEHTQALLYCGYRINFMAGRGMFIFLSRDGRKWRVKKIVGTWKTWQAIEYDH